MKVGRVIEQIVSNHIPIERLSYSTKVKGWLAERYGIEQARTIWRTTVENYDRYLATIPDYGGRRNSHATAIYGSLLIFALYPALPDQPPISELQEFVQRLFMEPFTKLGKVTPCVRAKETRCYDCKSPARLCKDLVINLRASGGTGVSEVVLVGESLGF